MSIELTPEQQAIIQSRVEAGFYDSPTSMIDKAIAVLEEQEERLARQREFFEREIKPALDSLDRGEGTRLNMDEIIAEANQQLDDKGVDF